MWPEIKRVKDENRHEIVLTGLEISERIKSDGLDPTIFDLTSLNYLDIHDTILAEIPDSIIKLINLQTLVLHSNKLTNVNGNIFQLDKLKLLDLSQNNLTTLSNLFGNLKNLTSLNVSNNLLEHFPEMMSNSKLTVLDLSKNKLKQFPSVCCKFNNNLSELKLSENEIDSIPEDISLLSSLKLLELNNNKIKNIPGDLSDCGKLKVLNLKNNPISDRRLLKLIDQCRTKQVIDYVKQHCPKNHIKSTETNCKNREKNQSNSDDDDDINYKYTITVKSSNNSINVVILDNVKPVREFFVGCIVNNIHFDEDSFKKFLQLQNKLHETVCSKRNQSTIATHDLKKLPGGNLTYTALPPNELILKPLNRTTTLTGSELFRKLQTEANNLRKEKKRNTYSGIHKYLSLIEGQAQYPCLLNASNEVISFPPITNSDISKIDLGTCAIFVEVTSSISLHVCKMTMDTLLKGMVLLFGNNLEVLQVKTTDVDGNLKTLYPSRCDLKFDKEIKIVRD